MSWNNPAWPRKFTSLLYFFLLFSSNAFVQDALNYGPCCVPLVSKIETVRWRTIAFDASTWSMDGLGGERRSAGCPLSASALTVAATSIGESSGLGVVVSESTAIRFLECNLCCWTGSCVAACGVSRRPWG